MANTKSSDWKIIQPGDDSYKEELIADHIYEVVTINGKVVTCRYTAALSNQQFIFEATNNWRDRIIPVAYREVKLPKNIFNHILNLRNQPDAKKNGKQNLVNYWINLV